MGKRCGQCRWHAHWIGFGHNVCILDTTSTLVGSLAPFVASEVAVTRVVAPPGDVLAFFLMQQALLPFADLPTSVEKIFSGSADDDDSREFAAMLEWIQRRVFGAAPTFGATLNEAREQSAQERDRFGISLVEEEVRNKFIALLRSDPGTCTVAVTPSIDAGTSITFAADGSWFRLSSGETTLIDRRPSRRLLVALLQRRQRSPGSFLRVDALIEAGWPDEHPIRQAGLNRVYVALSALRVNERGATPR